MAVYDRVWGWGQKRCWEEGMREREKDKEEERESEKTKWIKTE